jgi:hypothetical protein
MPRTFSREEFYDLVWSKPITHLAKEFVLSDVAIHKVCKKHDIPNPPLGWWAKKAAGKDVKQTPLPKARPGIPERVTIAAGQYSEESASLQSAREQARVLASSSGGNDGAPSSPMVAKTIARLRKAKPSELGLVAASDHGLIACEVAPASLDRLELILSRIVAAAALQGFRLVAGDAPAAFEGADETLKFSIAETTRRVKHELTEKEQAEEEAWRRKSERRNAAHNWDWGYLNRPHFPEWDYVCTGLLGIEFETVYVNGGQSPRKSFRDAKVQRLEHVAPDIAVAMAVLAAAKTERRLQFEEQARREEERRRLRELELRHDYIQQRRSKELDEILGEFAELDRLRKLVLLLESQLAHNANTRTARFLELAQQQLMTMENNLNSGGLEARLERHHLFGDDDDHNFQLPYRY